MKKPTRIFLLFALLTAFLCVAAAHAGNFAIEIASAPTVNGHAISAADLDGLQEIEVPVKVSADAPTEIALFALFHDADGKFLGMGMASASVDSGTTSVRTPVPIAVTGAKSLKIVTTDANFCPLTAARSYSLTGGSIDAGRENETPILYGFGA